MKTKEEIEQLAENSSEIQEATYTTQHKITYKHGYIDGYIQCQEDMTKDVEYWQGEFDHWHQQAMDMTNKYNELLNKQD